MPLWGAAGQCILVTLSSQTPPGSDSVSHTEFPSPPGLQAAGGLPLGKQGLDVTRGSPTIIAHHLSCPQKGPGSVSPTDRM